MFGLCQCSRVARSHKKSEWRAETKHRGWIKDVRGPNWSNYMCFWFFPNLPPSLLQTRLLAILAGSFRTREPLWLITAPSVGTCSPQGAFHWQRLLASEVNGTELHLSDQSRSSGQRGPQGNEDMQTRGDNTIPEHVRCPKYLNLACAEIKALSLYVLILSQSDLFVQSRRKKIFIKPVNSDEGIWSASCTRIHARTLLAMKVRRLPL